MAEHDAMSALDAAHGHLIEGTESLVTAQEMAVAQPDYVRWLVFALELVRQTRRSLGDIERDLVRELADAAPERQFDVPEVGAVHIRRSVRRSKWQHEEIAHEVAKALPDDLDPAAAIAAYRECVTTGAAKRLFVELTGVELDEVSQQDEAVPSVQITTPESAPRLVR